NHEIFRSVRVDGKNSGRWRTAHNRRGCGRPCKSTISRMKNSRARTAGCNPDMGRSGHSNTCPAGGKRGFARKRRRHVFTWNRSPRDPTVTGANDQEPAVNRINWITEGDTVVRIPKGEAIEETFRFMIRELQCPGVAAI